MALGSLETGRVEWKPGTVLYPVPVVLVTCGNAPSNIITVCWVGIVCTDPPMLSISVRPERYSHAIIEEKREFVVNLPTVSIVKSVDYCGVKSGRDIDKWSATGLTATPSIMIKTPQIEQCPVSLECVVRQQLRLGSHDCFIAEIVSVSVNKQFIDQKGYFDMKAAELLAYSHGHYYDLGNTLGHFGFSIKKNQPPKKRDDRGSSHHRH